MEINEISKLAKYRLFGHQPRSTAILKEAFDHFDFSYSDLYGRGPLINDFEEKMAQVLNKEKACFMPSGTMAQQIALRIYADQANCVNIAYHPLSHLEIHEQDAIRKIHHLKPILLGEKERLFTLADLKQVSEPLSSLLIELPQREIGGQLPTYAELKAICDYAHQQGVKVHLDGARLWESIPYYQKEIKEITALFDSVYVSFYKGIGGIAGAIIAGDAAFIEQVKIYKRRLGGDLISLYPYIIPADYFYEKRKNNFVQYAAQAKVLAKLFNQIPQIQTVPEVPQVNMFHVFLHTDQAKIKQAIQAVYEKYNLAITSHLQEINSNLYKFETSIGDCYSQIPLATIEEALKYFQAELQK